MSNHLLPRASQHFVPTTMLDCIPVFYTPLMVAETESFSPSAAKPAMAVKSWLEPGIPLGITAPEPVTVKDIARAHLGLYVDAVLSCQSENGFGNRSEAVAKSLPYASGAMHYGNGTDHIIDHLCVDWIEHYSAGQHYRFAVEAKRFLASIPSLVNSMKDCDVILCQAGADPHTNDPLGGWLTARQLYEREQLVFKKTAELGIPVAWNLAEGGYQTPLQKVLKIHDNTMRACAGIHLQK